MTFFLIGQSTSIHFELFSEKKKVELFSLLNLKDLIPNSFLTDRI